MDDQLAIIDRLGEALREASDPSEWQTATEILSEMSQRPDLFAVAARKIETIQSQFSKPPGTSASPSRVFVSYRREDAAWPARSLFMQLADSLGVDKVFHDVDSIQLGDDFVDAITAAVSSCTVLLALIGDGWLAITDEEGRRRLDDPKDFVRVEIEAALTRKVRVIPVLVGTAPVPRSDQLPPSLAELARRQALQLRPDYFESDIDPLLRMLASALTEGGVRPARQQPRPGELSDKPAVRRAPTLYAPTPLAGPPAAAVTLPGAGLGSAWDSQLTLNGSPIPVANWSANAIQFTVPANDPNTSAPWRSLPRTVHLAAMVMDQLSNHVDFTVQSPAALSG